MVHKGPSKRVDSITSHNAQAQVSHPRDHAATYRVNTALLHGRQRAMACD
jgi:hypothetical protein